MPASDVVFPGGVTVKGNGYTGDLASYVLELLQGAGGAYGLWNQTIPTFDDYATLVAAFPSPTVLGTPPLCRVYTAGDDVAAFYNYDPSGAAWVQLSNPDELRDASVSGGGTIINPGDTTGVTNGLTLLSAPGSRRVHLDFGALVNFGLAGDVVDVILRRDGTAVRSARVSAQPPLAVDHSNPDNVRYGAVPGSLSGGAGYTCNVSPGAPTTFQVVMTKVGGGGGCTSTNNGLLTYLQADVTLL